jgi:hypothetical protein
MYTTDGRYVETADEIVIHNQHDDDDPDEPEWFAAHKAETDSRFRALHDALSQIGYGLRAFFAEGPLGGQISGADDDGEEGTGAPRNVPANSAEARQPLWKGNANEMLTETSGRALDRSTLRTPADINRRAQNMKMRGSPHYRPTW